MLVVFRRVLIYDDKQGVVPSMARGSQVRVRFAGALLTLVAGRALTPGAFYASLRLAGARSLTAMLFSQAAMRNPIEIKAEEVVAKRIFGIESVKS